MKEYIQNDSKRATYVLSHVCKKIDDDWNDLTFIRTDINFEVAENQGSPFIAISVKYRLKAFAVVLLARISNTPYNNHYIFSTQ